MEHRDIKLENIPLAEGGAAVTDFGVAKALVDAGAEHGATLTSVGLAPGTPAYMAPEPITGDARTDHRAEIYALGVVAYEMLCGHNPFAGRSPQATMAAHDTPSPRPYPSKLPPLEYPAHFLGKRVTDAGTIRFLCRLLFLANALDNYHIGLEEVDDGIWSPYFGTVLLARLDERDCIIRG